MKDCGLSVHLIGSGYGAVPDGPAEKSVVIIQNELAIQRSKTSGLKRVIWLPEGTTSTHLHQQEFLRTLQHDAESQYGADLITGDFETLKRVIHASVQSLEQKKRATAAGAGSTDGNLIYLICDQRDRTATLPLRKFLKAHGFDVRIPVFQGDASSVRRSNEELFTQCDAVLLFYGAGDEAWKASVEHEMRKIKAYRGNKPLLASDTYLAEPETDDKRDLIELEEANVIDALSGFSEANLEKFLSHVRPV
jgi:hypothetical protein